MSHQRSLIRGALLNLLTGEEEDYATTAGAEVYANRTHNFKTLPVINITDGNETATPRDIRGTQYIRKFIVYIEILVKGTEGYDGTLDEIANEVETLISENRTINGSATTVKYISTEPSFEDGEQVIAKSKLEFEITYIY